MEHMEHMGCLSGHALRLVTCHSAFSEPRRHAGLAAAEAPTSQSTLPLSHCGLAAETAGRPLALVLPGTAARWDLLLKF